MRNFGDMRMSIEGKKNNNIMTITNFLYYMSTNLAQVSFYKAFSLYIKWFIDEYGCMNVDQNSWLGMGRGKPCCETWSM